MSTSTTRSLGLALAALAALAASSCDDGADASLVLEITRASHDSGLTLYVCGDGPATKCKAVETFRSGSGKDSTEVGVFVKDTSTKLNLQLQVSQPNDCAHFTVAFTADKVVPILIESAAGPGAPFTVSDCTTCTTPIKPCTYATRL